MTETIQHANGRVELKTDVLAEIEKSPLYNEDLNTGQKVKDI